MNDFNVLSLFDGMSCGQVALDRAKIKYSKYFASEIDKNSIQIAMKNYSNTIQIGDVTKLDLSNLPKIDFLIGGSPCKDLSIANKEKKGLNGNSSMLFYEYCKILKTLNPKWFFLENVVPIGKWKEVMDEHIDCVGITINSSLFVPQNRKRVYWTNIPYNYPIQQEYSFKFEENPSLKYLVSDNIKLNKDRMDFILSRKNPLCGCLTEAISRNGSSKEYMSYVSWVYRNTNTLRKLTPIECERMQGLTDDYTKGVSDTQRYRMIANGWTIDVIEHIFKELHNYQ